VLKLFRILSVYIQIGDNWQALKIQMLKIQ